MQTAQHHEQPRNVGQIVEWVSRRNRAWDRLKNLEELWREFSNGRDWYLDTMLREELARPTPSPSMIQALSARRSDLAAQRRIVRKAIDEARAARDDIDELTAVAVSLVGEAMALAPDWRSQCEAAALKTPKGYDRDRFL